MAIQTGPILATRNRHPQVDVVGALTKVRAEAGISPIRQTWEILQLNRGPGHLTASDYFIHGLYRETLTPEQKRAYLSVPAMDKLNRSLGDGTYGPMQNLINDKMLMSAVFTQAGVPTPPILAIHAPRVAPRGWPSLLSHDDIAQFLGQVSLPVFGKPMDGSLALGVMSLFDRDGDTGLMGDGREVSIKALATEIASHYANGYIFQPFLRNHAEIAEFNPRATQALRVVTLWAGAEPEVLYAMWRIPGKTALTDNNTTAGNLVVAGLDLATGTALRAHSLKMFGPLDGYDTHPDSDLRIEGRQLPHFGSALAMACEGHRIFPGHTLLGWDVVITQDGPVVLECNANPIHFGYQLAYRRGFLNLGIRAKLDPLRSGKQSPSAHPRTDTSGMGMGL